MKIIRSIQKNFKSELSRIIDRQDTGDNTIDSAVSSIIDDVKRSGDKAVIKYTRRFDGNPILKGGIKIEEEMIRGAYSLVRREDIRGLKFASRRIRAFHKREMIRGWSYKEDGVMLGQICRPLEVAGLYVPGGIAAYPSSVLMNGIPAKVAGVKKIIMCVPAPRGELNPLLLVAADMIGIDEIYQIGGAQAIAAMAFGTETVPKVDKIVGPGNIYVATAKRLVFGTVDIDMVAGPSEVLVIADESANPAFVAADLLSQAEHDARAMVVLVTDSTDMARRVEMELSRQLDGLERRDIARISLKDHGAIIITRDLAEAAEISNMIAPEHLELSVRKPLSLLKKIKNAGAIFLGHYTPESTGDYVAGPNHVLPTGGTARFFSPLCVTDFIKKSNVISYQPQALKRMGKTISRFASLEGLHGHARAVELRLKEIG
ncbi:MAG: histidinol dehydrogenase [Nitrospirota bacterium]